MSTNPSRKKRSALAIILRVAGCLLLALVLVFLAMMYAIPAFERADRTPVPGSADWMGRLPDNRPIGLIALPGTHDSATRNVQLAFFSKCQSLSIAEQLEAGFRYFDIRLAADGDRLKFMHGFTACTESGWPWAKPLHLDTVLGDVYAFLDAHPTEELVFVVKQEHGDESVAEFQTLLAAEIAKAPDRWLLDAWPASLGDARGKILLMHRYVDQGFGKASGVQLIWKDQGNREDTGLAAVLESNESYGRFFRFLVQDRYKYDADDKWAAFLGGLRSHSFFGVSSSQSDPNLLGIHFLSTNGNTSYGHPYTYAKDLNARFLSAKKAASDATTLRTGEDSVPLCGWIIVDFGSPALAEAIYGANF